MVEIGKFKLITLVLVLLSLGFLLAGMATSWYYVKYTDSTTNISRAFYFYSPKIVQEITTTTTNSQGTHSTWSDYDLKNTHNIFNTGLAFAAFSFMIGVFIIGITVLNIFGILSGDNVWKIARFMVFGMLLTCFIAVVVAAGISSAFKKDYEHASIGDIFIYCFETCDSSWRGSDSIGSVTVNYGPGTGWILTIVSLFVVLATSIVSGLSFFLDTPQ